MTWNNLLLILIAFGSMLLAWKRLTTKSLFPTKKRLVRLLEKAEKMVSKYEGGYSGEYLSAQEFHKDLKTAIVDYKNGDDSRLDQLYIWFAPTCQWDDFVGKEGESIANEIFEIVSKLKKK
ncbi:hypothetical protein J8L85_00205 [Maribacter sp. MMG018]|uniref:hypothetical protein n=1 Tax=Maribacter sp. MMG018 TaxID=2822688 RepID=UPI001B38E5A2|nr:hypothetical protein [Maribacter sp. MMG018]MBQ4912836.1 hypothetical protein [Maribacter sp. MMG018]